MDKQKMLERSEKLIPEKVELVYTDYDEDLRGQGEVIAACIKRGTDIPLLEKYYYWFGECVSMSVKNVIEELRADLVKEFDWKDVAHFIESAKDELREIIEDRDTSDPIGECLKRTRMRARIELCSNYEMFCPPSYNDRFCCVCYACDMMQLLQLNPKKVKEALANYHIPCVGRFNDYKAREGKEIVSYDDFATMVNDCTRYTKLTFLGIAPLAEMYDERFNIKKITLPAGTKVILYDSREGYGTIEIETIRPLTVDLTKTGKTKYDKVQLLLDEPERNGGRGYDTNSVYSWGYKFNNLFEIVK